MGSLAVQKPKEGHRVSGVLIKRGFNYHLVDPKDLASENKYFCWFLKPFLLSTFVQITQN